MLDCSPPPLLSRFTGRSRRKYDTAIASLLSFFHTDAHLDAQSTLSVDYGIFLATQTCTHLLFEHYFQAMDRCHRPLMRDDSGAALLAVYEQLLRFGAPEPLPGTDAALFLASGQQHGVPPYELFTALCEEVRQGLKTKIAWSYINRMQSRDGRLLVLFLLSLLAVGRGLRVYSHAARVCIPVCHLLVAMESEGVDAALARSPIELLASEGHIHDTMKRIVELGGPAAASAVIAAIPAMARAGAKTWDLAWYYIVCTKYRPYTDEWIMPFFQLRMTDDAKRIPDYWRRIYVACSMLIRLAWVAAYELLLAPDATFSMQPNTALVAAIGRMFDIAPGAESDSQITNLDAEFFEDVPLENYALALQPLSVSIPFATMEETISLPPGAEIAQTDEETQRERMAESERIQLPMELAGTVTEPVSLRASAQTHFRRLLDGLASGGRAAALLDFRDTFYVRRAIGDYAASRTRGLSVESTFRLAGFSASAVLLLWRTLNEGEPPHRWGAFSDAANSPSSLAIGEILRGSSRARAEIRVLFAFGAQSGMELDVLRLLGDEDARPDWMEKLGMRYRGSPQASVVLGAAPLSYVKL